MMRRSIYRLVQCCETLPRTVGSTERASWFRDENCDKLTGVQTKFRFRSRRTNRSLQCPVATVPVALLVSRLCRLRVRSV